MLMFVPLVLIGNEVGAMLRYPDLGAAILFPPYALLTAVLLASPRRHWVWYIGVATLAHAFASYPHWTLSWVLFADVANDARAIVCTLLLQSLLRGESALDGVHRLMAFLVAAVVVAPAVGATIGAVNVVIHDRSTTYVTVWNAWFLSSAVTAMTMLPGLLVLTREWPSWRSARVQRARVGEAAMLCMGLAAMCAGTFFLHLEGRGALTWLLCAPLPLLIWTALRFGHVGASLALTGVAFTAIYAADRGAGPFVAIAPDDRVISLQLFMLLTALPVLCIAAIGGARRGAVRLYRSLLASLQDHVAVIDASGTVFEVNESWRLFASAEQCCPVHRASVGDNYLAACRASIALHERAENIDG